MNHFLLLILLSLFAMVQTKSNNSRNESNCSGEDISLDEFRWENRIIVMFAQNSDIESYERQMNEFLSLEDELNERDLILISVFDIECATLDDEIITDSSADDIRSRLSPPNKGYSIFLIGKDGGVKLKQDEFLAPEELFSVIDRMPMRQREMRDGGYMN